jgi:ubiquinone/menaquinone biosynthesis C-methylase UbiE
MQKNVAAGWKEWWETFEIAAQKVSDRLVQLADIKPGQKVLDIATGTVATSNEWFRHSNYY